MADTWNWKDELPKLAQTCDKISSLTKEATEDGSLMHSQLMFIGDLIREFVNSPIVKQSGIIQEEIKNRNL